jgi:hypothetical membrane protein
VPGWGVFSAAAALVFLVGGCTAATVLQPPSFNWLASTVSTLTEREAADPWVMTAAVAATGACVIATALALRPAAMPGRLILAAAGAASVLVAANPEHVGGSPTHGLWSGVTLIAMIAWPTGAWRRGPSAPWGLRPAVSAAAVATLLALLAWYLMELTTKGATTGLAERVMGTAEVSWPLAVVSSCRRPAKQRTPAPSARCLRVRVGATYPLEDAADAQRALAAGGTKGKVVIELT